MSYRLLWFEADPPGVWPEKAMAAITTHDLPTVAGLWDGSDLDAQRDLGLDPNEESTREIVERLAKMGDLGSGRARRGGRARRPSPARPVPRPAAERRRWTTPWPSPPGPTCRARTAPRTGRSRCPGRSRTSNAARSPVRSPPFSPTPPEGPPRDRRTARCRARDLARKALPARGRLRRRRHQLRPLLRGRRARRRVPLRSGRQRTMRHPALRDRADLARVPAGDRPRPALRVPRARPVAPRGGSALQPRQAAARPVRQGGRRRGRLGPGLLPVQLRGRGLAQRRRQRPAHPEGRRRQPVLRLVDRQPAADAVGGHRRVRDARQGLHDAPPRDPGEPARDVCGPRAPGRHRVPDLARHHRRRASAGASVPARRAPGRPRPAQLLGLQLDRLLRPAQRLHQGLRPRRARCRSSRRWSARCTRPASR